MCVWLGFCLPVYSPPGRRSSSRLRLRPPRSPLRHTATRNEKSLRRTASGRHNRQTGVLVSKRRRARRRCHLNPAVDLPVTLGRWHHQDRARIPMRAAYVPSERRKCRRPARRAAPLSPRGRERPCSADGDQAHRCCLSGAGSAARVWSKRRRIRTAAAGTAALRHVRMYSARPASWVASGEPHRHTSHMCMCRPLSCASTSARILPARPPRVYPPTQFASPLCKRRAVPRRRPDELQLEWAKKPRMLCEHKARQPLQVLV